MRTPTLRHLTALVPKYTTSLASEDARIYCANDTTNYVSEADSSCNDFGFTQVGG